MSMPDQKKKNADDCKKYPFHGRFSLGAMKIELDVFSGSLGASARISTITNTRFIALDRMTLKEKSSF